MFQISDVSCRSGSHISHFTYTQPHGTTHVLLSQNADYLDGLQGILTGNEPYSGEIALNGRRYAVQRAAFMTRTFRMYREQTVIANVLTDLGFRQLGGKKGQRLFSALTEETGLSLDPSRTISQMTITEQKMVELLRIFDQKPELLIIRGLSSFVSVDMFQKMMQLVERLNEAGWVREDAALYDRALLPGAHQRRTGAGAPDQLHRFLPLYAARRHDSQMDCAGDGHQH